MLNEYNEVALTITKVYCIQPYKYCCDPQNLYLVYNAVYKLI